MLQLKLALGAYMLATALIPTLAAQAATYYVSTIGSDGNPGTISQPWRTLTKAASTMIAGDTTYVRGGTYVEAGLIKFKVSGTQASPIKLLNYNGENPIIDCVDGNIQNLKMILIQNEGGAHLPMGWFTIEGFEIKRCSHGLKAYNLHDSVLRRNWIHDNFTNGMLLNGSARITIDRNRINHNGKFPAADDDGSGHGLYINGSSHIVTNNLIYDSSNYGIQINGTFTVQSIKNVAGPEFAESNNWIISNNTFAYSHFAAAIVIWGSHANNIRIENNIFYEGNVKGTISQGIRFVSCCSTGGLFRNNLAYASGSGAIPFIQPGYSHYTESGNIVNVSNPGFVNAPATLPVSPNFALTERSPAIDKGLSPEEIPDIDKSLRLTTTRVDFNNTPRPQGGAYDIGAYEYSAGSDSQKPDRVQDVQLH